MPGDPRLQGTRGRPPSPDAGARGRGEPAASDAEAWRIPSAQWWVRGRPPGDEVTLDPVSGGYQVFGYAECHRVLTDVESFSSDFGAFGVGPPTDPLDRFINHLDPPLHTEVRKLLGAELRPSVVHALEPRIAELVEESLVRLEERNEVDLVDALTYPVPVRVMTELIGLPPQDWPLFRAWVEGITGNFELVSTLDDPEESRAALEAGQQHLTEFIAYLEDEVRRCRPSDTSLVGRLRQSALGGAAMSDRQVARFLLILLVAGHITTTMLVGNALLCLDDRRDLRAQVLDDPARLDEVLDEAARLYSPFAALSRITRAPVRLGDHLLQAGTPVVVWVGSANRDGRQFSAPHEFAPGTRAQRHLSFGAGVHACPGASLARTEGRIILDRLLRTYPDLTARRDSIRFHASANTCGVQDLSVSLGPRSSTGPAPGASGPGPRVGCPVQP